jgi:hypothetical protein
MQSALKMKSPPPLAIPINSRSSYVGRWPQDTRVAMTAGASRSGGRKAPKSLLEPPW